MDYLKNAFLEILVKLQSWLDHLVLSIPNLILFFLSLWVGIKLIKLLKRYVKKLLARTTKTESVNQLILNVISAFFYLILAIILLSILGLQKPITAVLASAGVAGLAVGLALQDPLMNIFSGVIMGFKALFRVGDYIESNNLRGSVEEIGLRYTTIKEVSGEYIHIPNKMIVQQPLKNYSTAQTRRIGVNCGVAYGSNLDEVRALVLKSVASLDVSLNDMPFEFIYTEFAASSINFQARFWINATNIWQGLHAKSEAIMDIKKRFDEHGITIPFPIQTLELSESMLKDGKFIGFQN